MSRLIPARIGEMAEYWQSAHAVFDLKYHLIWCTKYRKKVLRGRIAEGARDLIRQICAAASDRARCGIAGSRPPVAGSPADSGTGQAGAVHQRAFVTASTGGVPRAEKTVLGPAYVGTRILLRDGGRSGRKSD